MPFFASDEHLAKALQQTGEEANLEAVRQYLITGTAKSLADLSDKSLAEVLSYLREHKEALAAAQSMPLTGKWNFLTSSALI
ncbi:MAG: hypothetical protein R2865_07395 [Deinococcales bacterium]